MPRGRPKHPDVLTPREWEVLALLREGLTNPQIAVRLGISEAGAKYHVLEILSKLGVATRYEAAAWQREPVGVSRRYGLFGVLLAWRPPKWGWPSATKAGAAVLVAGVVGFMVALTAGVIIMDQRSDSPETLDSEPQSRTTPAMTTPAPTAAPRLRATIPIGPDLLTEMPANGHEKLAEFAASIRTSYAGVCSSSTQPGHLCLTAFDGAGDIQHRSILAQVVISGQGDGYQILLTPTAPSIYEIANIGGPYPSAIPPQLLDTS